MSRAPDPWRDLEVEDVAKSQTLERVQGRPLSQSIPAAHVALHPGMSVEARKSHGLPGHALYPQSDTACWGFLLRNNGTQCTPEFSATSGPFKTRMCAKCLRDGIWIDPARVRILASDVTTSLINSSAHGLWSQMPGDGIKYRVINQTIRCSGPPLLLLPDVQSTAGLTFPTIPSAWLRSGLLKLDVSKGTLVPRDASEGDGTGRCPGMPSVATSSSGFYMHDEGGSCPSSNDANASSSSKRPRPDASPLCQHPWCAAASAASTARAPVNASRVVVSAGASSRACAEAGAEVDRSGSAGPSEARLRVLAGSPESAQGRSQPLLLSLAESHAKLTSDLLRTLRLASEAMEHGDSTVAAYNDSVRALVGPFTEASTLLQQVVLHSEEPMPPRATQPAGSAPPPSMPPSQLPDE